MNTKAAVALFVISPALPLVAFADELAPSASFALYEQQCAECHGARLQGTGHGSDLSGPIFQRKWKSRPVAEFFEVLAKTMPAGKPGSLNARDAKTLTAFILKNDVSALSQAIQRGTTVGNFLSGDTTQPSNAPDEVTESWQGASGVAEAAREASGFINKTVGDYSAVTSEMLADPPAGDWLSWRRTMDGWGYSPLDQVNRDNVDKLTLAWAISMRDGSNQITPLVHDGIMYLTHAENVIQAINAETGEVIWEYENSFPPGSRTLGGPTRSIAIYENKLFMATYDAAIVAIDARTGEELWKTVKADWNKGFTHTSGPTVADGVVISGINGCERYKPEGCFITGHDPDSGKELWRTSTIAMPGEPHGDTWAGLPGELRAGGDTWMPGSYDPVSKLFYIGTAQAKPWVAASRGMSPRDAALYTNSTLALEPKSGDIVWHFQHIAGETLDMEVGFERILVDLGGRKQLVTIGKDGILWKLDRLNGAFAGLTETMRQNIFSKIDRETGRLTYRHDIIDARINESVDVCPSIYGGHNWQSAAYDPVQQSLIIPLHQLCVEMTGREVDLVDGGGGYGGESRIYPLPEADGMLGRLTAFDLNTMQQKWNYTQRAVFLTGALTTSGGLTFIGDMDRWFKAFDSSTGEELWKVRLGAGLHGYPIAYAVDGVQYVAVPTGLGVFKLMTAKQAPEIYQPAGGNALYVFRLGE